MEQLVLVLAGDQDAGPPIPLDERTLERAMTLMASAILAVVSEEPSQHRRMENEIPLMTPEIGHRGGESDE